MAAAPKVSVIVATRDRAEFLGRSLAAFAHQRMPRPSFEVIVVDNGSQDHTRRVVASIARRRLFRLRCLLEAKPGPAAARNAGIAASRGAILVFLDDTCMPHPDFLAEHERAHEEDPGRAVIGRTNGILSCWSRAVLAGSRTTQRPLRLTGRAELWFFGVQDVLKEFPRMGFFPSEWYFDYRRLSRRRRLGWRNFATANVSLARETLEKSGRFNEAFRGWGLEDTELGYRLHRAGVRFGLAPRAVCYHQQHPMDFTAARRSFRRNLALFRELHPSRELEAFERQAAAQARTFLSRVKSPPDGYRRDED